MRHPSVLLVALGLLATACSSGTGDATDATTAAPATTVTTATTEPVATTTEPTTTTTIPPTTAPAPTTVAADPLELAGAGPYAVGVATITLDDPAGERPLTVDVWFPLSDAASALSPQRYTLLPGVYYESPSAFAATAPDAAAGPFPLVVYSHGSGGLRYVHSAYTESLASHGYVVAAPDHTGNTVIDQLTGATPDPQQIAFDRPTDVGRVIDAFVDPAHPTAGGYAAHVDPERVAVTGHSLGGYTAVAMVTGMSDAVGSVPADARVDAIVPLAPALSDTLITDDLLAGLDVPMLVVVGTDDVTTPVDPNVTRLWDRTANAPAYRVELMAGEHQTFTDLCSYQEVLPSLDGVPQPVIDVIDDYAVEGCSPGDMPLDRANELLTTYAVAFLAEVFTGGPPITAAAPDDVVFQSR